MSVNDINAQSVFLKIAWCHCTISSRLPSDHADGCVDDDVDDEEEEEEEEEGAMMTAGRRQRRPLQPYMSYHSGGHYWDCYDGTLYLCQITATHLNAGHP